MKLKQLITLSDNESLDPHLIALWIGLISYIGLTIYHNSFDLVNFATGYGIICGVGGLVNKCKDWEAGK